MLQELRMQQRDGSANHRLTLSPGRGKVRLEVLQRKYKVVTENDLSLARIRSPSFTKPSFS